MEKVGFSFCSSVYSGKLILLFICESDLVPCGNDKFGSQMVDSVTVSALKIHW